MNSAERLPLWEFKRLLPWKPSDRKKTKKKCLLFIPFLLCVKERETGYVGVLCVCLFECMCMCMCVCFRISSLRIYVCINVYLCVSMCIYGSLFLHVCIDMSHLYLCTWRFLIIYPDRCEPSGTTNRCCTSHIWASSWPKHPPATFWRGSRGRQI